MKIKNYINCLSILIGLVWISNLPAQNVWESMVDMPQATSYYGSCIDSISEKAYIFGGGGPSETLLLLDTTQIYDFKTDTWSLGANMVNAASSFSAEIVNGKIYIIGEYLKPQTLTNVKEYDPVNDTWITKGPLPEIFYAHGSCVYDGLIYSFGGRDVDFNLINTVRTYDPLTDTWSKLGDMPYKRDKSAVCIYENEIYLFGDNPSLKYTPSTDSWTELNAGICEIVAYAVPIIYGETIFLFGGYKSGGNYPNPSNEIWAYYPIQDTLVKLDNEMPFNRFTRGHKYNNYVYLFGGHYNNTLGSVTNEVWRYFYPNSINENEYVFREDFTLHQNYPNPFSGVTVINYELLEPAFISIDIFDILGKKMAGLINEFQGIGKHEIEWNINGLSPGIYFAVLSDGKTQQHIKMNISK
jgi:N-acetylneuraminic acid mutarotase